MDTQKKLNDDLLNATTVEEFDRLLKLGADVNAKASNGWTSLMWASSNGHSEAHQAIVELLLANKADVDAKDRYGYTALMRASYNGHKAIVELLLAGSCGSNGAEVEAKNSNGCTALMLASERGQKEIVEILLDAGADINAKSNNGNKAIHFVTSVETARVLIDNYADPEAIGSNNRTLLQMLRNAVAEDNEANEELIAFLINECGVNI